MAVGLADLVDLHDVRMLQAHRRLGLDAEARQLTRAGMPAASSS